MKVLPCPPECGFDWQAFHQHLDVAAAHLITDAKIDTPGNEYLPSKTSVLTLLQYATEKAQMTQPDPDEIIGRATLMFGNHTTMQLTGDLDVIKQLVDRLDGMEYTTTHPERTL